MSLRLMVFADLHYGGVFQEGERCIKELTDVMEREKPDACIYLGDLCEPIPKHKHVREKLEKPGFQIYYIIGNHETDDHELDEIKEFLGPDEELEWLKERLATDKKILVRIKCEE